MKTTIDQEISFLNLALKGVSFVIRNSKMRRINDSIVDPAWDSFDSQCLVSLASLWHGDRVSINCSGVNDFPEKALQESIDKINAAINYDREYNERIICCKDIPVLTKQAFVDFKIARTIQIGFTENDKTKSVYAYIWDQDDGNKKYIFDGMKKAEIANSDDVIIEKIINSYVPGKRIKKIKEFDLKKQGIYPISKVFRR